MLFSYTYSQGVKRRNHHWLSRLLVALVVFGVVFGAIYAASMVVLPLHRQQPVSVIVPHIPKTVAQKSTNYGLPVRLQIPKLQVDAPVIYVGITKGGNMAVPGNVIETGWYKYGALPGNIGTAVIAGHLDGLRGEPGVFSHLDKLAPGDTISVTENNGLIVTFVVREKQSYSQNEQPPEVFTSNGGSHLNLITCTGSWDSTDHQFVKRLVVFADKVN